MSEENGKTPDDQSFSIADLEDIHLLYSAGERLAGNETVEPTEGETTGNIEELLEETLRSIERMSRYTHAGEDAEPKEAAAPPDRSTSKGEAVNKEDGILRPDTLFSMAGTKRKREPDGEKESGYNKQADHSAQRETTALPRPAQISRPSAKRVSSKDGLPGRFLGGLLWQNPVLADAWGLCPLLIAAQDARSAGVLAFFASLIFLVSALAGPFLRRFVPFALHPPSLVALGTGMFFAFQALFGEGLFSAVQLTGIYLPMLAVGSFSAVSPEREKQPVFLLELVGALGRAAGYAAVIFLVAEIRELLTAGTLFGRSVGLPFAVSAAALPFAAFFILAFAGALVRFFAGKMRRD